MPLTNASLMTQLVPPCSIFGVAWILVGGWGHADIKDPKNLERSPIPRPVALQVVRGESADITLNALTASTREVEFLLRNTPGAGKLGELVRKSSTSVLVRYTSDPKSTAKQDSFKYAARLEGGSVSPAEEVRITIIDRLAILAVTEKVDVGAVKIGQERTGEISLRNTGTAEFSRDILLTGDWSWLGDGGMKVAVKPGETIRRHVVFRPTQSGPSEQLVIFQDSPTGKVKLSGQGLPPFEAPTAVPLEWVASSRERKGSLKISNPSATELLVKISPVIGLNLPREVQVPAGGAVELPLLLQRKLDEPVRERLKLEIGDASQEVLLISEPAPALLELSGEIKNGIIDFGTVKESDVPTTGRKLEIRNVGGTTATVFGVPPVSFVIAGFTSGLEIRPGQSAPLMVKIRDGALGTLTDKVTWEWNKNPLGLALSAHVLKAGQGAPIILAPSNATGSGMADTAPLDEQDQSSVDMNMRVNRFGILMGDFTIDPKLPRPEKVYQKSESRNSVVMAWTPAPGGEFTEYVVLKRQIMVVGGLPRPVWGKCEEAKISRQGEAWQAELTDLPPNWSMKLKVMTRGLDGKYSPPTGEYVFAVAPPFEFPWKKVLFSAAMIGGFWLLWRTRHKQRRQRLLEIHRRLAQPDPEG